MEMQVLQKLYVLAHPYGDEPSHLALQVSPKLASSNRKTDRFEVGEYFALCRSLRHAEFRGANRYEPLLGFPAGFGLPSSRQTSCGRIKALQAISGPMCLGARVTAAFEADHTRLESAFPAAPRHSATLPTPDMFEAWLKLVRSWLWR
ncbi:hypothetical protein MPH_06896 [Macrophomina phaseolina MS6]|uniref:Uncharacterized protein n=1 Tax=Macrophomina phaseolina (strain MS6) TaxID=1126212 RepID=K2SGG8_MACPH|nr:hypothetical protein MPH_06896 [Macrophomina phaseolina MS6]